MKTTFQCLLGFMVLFSAGSLRATTDNFLSDSGYWAAPVTAGGGGFSLGGGIMSFTSTGALTGQSSTASMLWQPITPASTESWAVQMDVARASSIPMLPGQFCALGVTVAKDGDPTTQVECSLRDNYMLPSNNSQFEASVLVGSVSAAQATVGPLATLAGTLFVSFDAATRMLTASYDADGASNGYTPVSLLSVDISGTSSNWGMASSDKFVISMNGNFGANAAPGAPITGGMLYSSSFKAVPEPGSLVLLGLGMASLLGFARRRRNA